MAKRLIIGVGNHDRGDDAIGPTVIDDLRRNPPEETTLFKCNGDIGALMDIWQNFEQVIVIDACQSGAAPGTLHTFDAAATPLPTPFFSTSTHGLGLAQAVELARRLGTLPSNLTIYAIESDTFEIGQPLSPPARTAVAALANQIF